MNESKIRLAIVLLSPLVAPFFLSGIVLGFVELLLVIGIISALNSSIIKTSNGYRVLTPREIRKKSSFLSDTKSSSRAFCEICGEELSTRDEKIRGNCDKCTGIEDPAIAMIS